jgi:hypothetical protein
VWLPEPALFGEWWQNNHHAFPNSAFQGMRPLRSSARSGRLGDHPAREARARLEGRSHSSGAPGEQVARRLSRVTQLVYEVAPEPCVLGEAKPHAEPTDYDSSAQTSPTLRSVEEDKWRFPRLEPRGVNDRSFSVPAVEAKVQG